MKLAYVTPFDSRNLLSPNNWSGTGYYISQALKNQFIEINYIGPLQNKPNFQLLCKFKSRYYSLIRKKNYIKQIEPFILKSYAKQILHKLNQINADIVFSALSDSIAYLDCELPIAFWADATFANLIDYYPAYSNLCKESIDNYHLIQKKSLERSKLAIYSSDWAAQKAASFYEINSEKIKVVPFGANVETSQGLEEIKFLIQSRPKDICKLLFFGVDWLRKGGDVALQVAKQLNESGLKTELTIIGCQPSTKEKLPSFVKFLGFISKSTPEGKDKIYKLLSESHFLILPSLADCTPIVFCEANALGVPCISRKTGGIPTIIIDNLNGKLFDVEAAIAHYCDYISDIFMNYHQYEQLALSSFNEYQSRLNWKTSGQTVKQLLKTLV